MHEVCRFLEHTDSTSTTFEHTHNRKERIFHAPIGRDTANHAIANYARQVMKYEGAGHEYSQDNPRHCKERVQGIKSCIVQEVLTPEGHICGSLLRKRQQCVNVPVAYDRTLQRSTSAEQVPDTMCRLQNMGQESINEHCER